MLERHGETKGGQRSPEWLAWRNMIDRCTNRKCSNYKHYGGRGISVDKLWMKFEPFLEDVGRRPSPRHSIDRIDNNGDYTPGNVCWSLPKQQCRNRQNSRIITALGKAMTVAEWAESTGIPYQTIWHRICTHNWNAERAITTPSRGERVRHAS